MKETVCVDRKRFLYMEVLERSYEFAAQRCVLPTGDLDTASPVDPAGRTRDAALTELA